MFPAVAVAVAAAAAAACCPGAQEAVRARCGLGVGWRLLHPIKPGLRSFILTPVPMYHIDQTTKRFSQPELAVFGDPISLNRRVRTASEWSANADRTDFELSLIHI